MRQQTGRVHTEAELNAIVSQYQIATLGTGMAEIYEASPADSAAFAAMALPPPPSTGNRANNNTIATSDGGRMTRADMRQIVLRQTGRVLTDAELDVAMATNSVLSFSGGPGAEHALNSAGNGGRGGGGGGGNKKKGGKKK